MSAGPPIPLAELKQLSLIDEAQHSARFGIHSWIEQAQKARTAAEQAVAQSTGADDQTLERMFVALRKWAGCVSLSDVRSDRPAA